MEVNIFTEMDLNILYYIIVVHLTGFTDIIKS